MNDLVGTFGPGVPGANKATLARPKDKNTQVDHPPWRSFARASLPAGHWLPPDRRHTLTAAATAITTTTGQDANLANLQPHKMPKSITRVRLHDVD